MEIWDIHCHLPSNRIEGTTFGEQLDRLMEIGHRVGIERFGIFVETGRDSGPHSDKEIEKALNRHQGRAFGFNWCTLYRQEETLDKLQRWIADGPMVGLKLGASSGICSEPEYDPIFAKAIDLQAVIYQHTWMKVGGMPRFPGGGNLPHESQPEHVVELAARYPDYPIICGHTGGDWELGIRSVRASQNALIETGGSFPTRGFVEMAVRELGARRVVYGSDVTGRSFATQLGKVQGAEIPITAKADILGGNLRRLLTPILKRKGIAV